MGKIKEKPKVQANYVEYIISSMNEKVQQEFLLFLLECEKGVEDDQRRFYQNISFFISILEVLCPAGRGNPTKTMGVLQNQK